VLRISPKNLQLLFDSDERKTHKIRIGQDIQSQLNLKHINSFLSIHLYWFTIYLNLPPIKFSFTVPNLVSMISSKSFNIPVCEIERSFRSPGSFERL